MLGKRPDISAAVQMIRGQIAGLEQTALALWYDAQSEQNEAAKSKMLDEYDACLELMRQYEDVLKRAAR